MFPHALSSGVPAAVLDMTADFTPLFVGMVLLLSFCVIAFAFAIGVHDTREAQRSIGRDVTAPTEMPKAA
jgi:hypothetical protein